MIFSTGHLRRLTHPILLRYWLKRGTDLTVTTQVCGFTLRILPSVFHPKYFGSSSVLADYIGSLELGGKTFLDMGTGSGIAGMAAARNGAKVTAVDINAQAVRCCAENAVAAGLPVEVLESDLFSALANRTFDIVAWNPPFFPKPIGSAAEAALFAGPKHAVIERFAKQCREHLNPAGRIILVLSLDIDVAVVEAMFIREGFRVRRVASEKWGLGETMIVVEIR